MKRFAYRLLDRVQSEDPAWKESGTAFITSITRLLERLLDYRSVIQGDENRDKRMSCTVNLLVRVKEGSQNSRYNANKEYISINTLRLLVASKKCRETSQLSISIYYFSRDLARRLIEPCDARRYTCHTHIHISSINPMRDT